MLLAFNRGRIQPISSKKVKIHWRASSALGVSLIVMVGSNLSGIITSPFDPIGRDHGSVSKPMVSIAKVVLLQRSKLSSTRSAQKIQSDQSSKVCQSARLWIKRLEATQNRKRVYDIGNDILMQTVAYRVKKCFSCKL